MAHHARAPRRPRLTSTSRFLRPTAAQLTNTALGGWVADNSQRLLVDLVVEVAPLTVIPGIVTLP